MQAPPGAGKTTVVPPALLHEPWLRGRKIVMLEPRRLAARAAAHRMAALRGEEVGETVGYRVRRDTRVGPRTRIEVVTEGVLTRMLNSDPTLDGVGLLIFDEFHERSIHADLGLALALHSQHLVREDLRILVMSATIASGPVARLLGDAPVVASVGRSYPIDVRYVPRRADQRLEAAVASAVRLALAETEGDILAFLPGQGEIARTHELLLAQQLDAELHPLFGNLSFAEQDRAIMPSPHGRRKVIIATSIAESSLTIDGVRCVVDSGLSRVPRFSPRTGMTSLETVRVSQASADQRAGRAGRQAPGTCYRLWPEDEQSHLLAFSTPEILEADLAPLTLELAAAGITDPAELRWLDPPPAGALSQARSLLRWLDTLDDHGRITPHGVKVAGLATHPRLAHLLVRARELGLAPLACDLVALLEDRDVLRSDGPEHDADLCLRVDLVRKARRGDRLPDRVAGMQVSRDAVRKAAEGARAWRRELGVPRESDWTDDGDTGRLVALAWPERVAQRRPGGASRFLLRNGAGVTFRDSPALAREPWVVVAETDGRLPESTVYLAAALTLEDIHRDFDHQVERADVVEWDDASRTVRATHRESLGSLVLNESAQRSPDPEAVAGVLLAAIRDSGLSLLRWSESAQRLRERLAFLHRHLDEWPDVSDAALLGRLEEWLGPFLLGVRSVAQLDRLDMGRILLDALPGPQRGRLDPLAPTHFTAPTGSRLPIDYSDAAGPVVRVRLQEMFGLHDTPRVLEGRVPVTLHLLSPAHRPVQVTQDLAGFWRTSYFDVKKEMKGRYPRHFWPDDPLIAEPTRRAKGGR